MSSTDRYTARIGDLHALGEEIAYDALLERIIEFTARAALARCIDESDWEHEVLRRRGLNAVQIARNGRAIWTDRVAFEEDCGEARRERDARFEAVNELDPGLYARLDCDLRAHWRSHGYEVPSLLEDMKKLFSQLERDADGRAFCAREGLLTDLLKGSYP